MKTRTALKTNRAGFFYQTIKHFNPIQKVHVRVFMYLCGNLGLKKGSLFTISLMRRNPPNIYKKKITGCIVKPGQ